MCRYQKLVWGCLLAGWLLTGGWSYGQTVLVDFGNDSSFAAFP
jgi:hypothetical protein